MAALKVMQKRAGVWHGPSAPCVLPLKLGLLLLGAMGKWGAGAGAAPCSAWVEMEQGRLMFNPDGQVALRMSDALPLAILRLRNSSRRLCLHSKKLGLS